jgi:hypothetical protein
MEAKALPDFPLIKEVANKINQIQDKTLKAGGLTKLVSDYTNDTLSNALGLDFFTTASIGFNHYVKKPTKLAVKATNSLV